MQKITIEQDLEHIIMPQIPQVGKTHFTPESLRFLHLTHPVCLTLDTNLHYLLPLILISNHTFTNNDRNVVEVLTVCTTVSIQKYVIRE